MAVPVVADTHALLWMLDGTLPRALPEGRQRLGDALNARALHVSVGSFLDLRYLVDSGRRPSQVFDDARSIVDGEAFAVVPLGLPVIDKMAAISKDIVPDPFDRTIAATAVVVDLPLVTADKQIQKALGERAVW